MQYSIQDKVVIRVRQCNTVILRIGHILEIKSQDQYRIYLRLYWMYRPEDLPQGRQHYHGRDEMIATDHMAIADASNIVKHAFVAHWIEAKGEVQPQGLYWRQQFKTVMEALSVGLCHPVSTSRFPNSLVATPHRLYLPETSESRLPSRCLPKMPLSYALWLHRPGPSRQKHETS